MLHEDRMGDTDLEDFNDTTDRISNLPDVLLQHILSMLGTKEAGRTCVLAKRWKGIWANVQVLNVSCDDFRTSGCSYEETAAKIQLFVRGVLDNRDPSSLRKLKLDYSTHIIFFIILERFIFHAMKLKPQTLSLSVHKELLLSFEVDPIFTCASLQDMFLEQNLRESFFEIRPNSVNLPCLTKLHLDRVKIVNDGFMDKLFLGCPILEELLLHNSHLNFYKISSGTLKKLVLLDCYLESDLKISTPALVDFVATVPMQFIPDFLGKLSWDNMASLVNARIEFPTLYFADAFTDSEFKFLTSLSSVTNLDLRLRSPVLGVPLEMNPSNFPIFNNLKTLKIGGWYLHEEFDLIALFLRSPNLERLTLHFRRQVSGMRMCELFSVEGLWNEEEDFKYRDVSFQLEYLEIVQILQYSVPDEWIAGLVKNLRAHVKTIGKIIVE